LAGGVTGGVIGGTNAYWSALQQQQMDQAALYYRVSSDLARENEAIDKTQLAFDQLEDCRFRQAADINAAYAAHRIDRAAAEAAMAQVRQRVSKDLALAKLINQQIQGRGQQFAVATGNIDASAAAAMASQPQVQQVTVRSLTPMVMQPSPTAPAIGQLQPREQVTARPARNGYALVETSSGQQGYVSASSLRTATGRSVSVASAAPTGAASDVRTLAGSNAARRDDFAQSVSVMEKAQATGFELTG
jgi:hypothetical protein